MPRQARLDAAGTLHHIMARGIERTEIFRNTEDREDFITRLAERCLSAAISIYAWVLMSNHFHLLVRTGERPLAESMRKILTGYVVNFNRRHSRAGHLFQNRYKSIVCEDDPYLLEITRYIHLNPVRAKIVKNIGALRQYPWSGHAVIMGKAKREWQDINTVLRYFGKRRKEAITRYEGYIKEGSGQGRQAVLEGGGLLRSVGGWSEVIALRHKGEKVVSDERILGRGEFVEGIIKEAEAYHQEALRLTRRAHDLSKIVKVIERLTGVMETELRSGNKRKTVVEARKILSQVAVRRMGYAGAFVSRYLGVTTSAVNRLAGFEESPEVERIMKLL
jgi:putative transposase